MEIITSRENYNIKELVKLMSSKKERREQGQFVIEGIRLLGDAVTSGILIHKFFYTETSYIKNTDQIQKFIENSEQSFMIAEHLSDKISDTNSPQGVYSICKMLDNNSITDKICLNGRYIILHSLQDPGNVGTIIRSCEAFGVDLLVLSSDCPDIYSPKVLRSAMGGVFRQSIVVAKSTEECINSFKQHGALVYAADLTKDAVNILQLPVDKSLAIVIGNEGNGIPNEIIKLCDGELMIPMNGMAESLNASVAASIIAWEITKNK